MKAKTEPKTTRSISLPCALDEQLLAVAARECRTVSNLIVHFLRHAVSQQSTRHFSAVAADNLRETRRARRVKSATPTA